MKLSSKKARIYNFLKNSELKKSDIYANNINGYNKISHGYKFKKLDNETYILYFEKGNMKFKNLSYMQCNGKTLEYLNLIQKNCNLNTINISSTTGILPNGLVAILIK